MRPPSLILVLVALTASCATSPRAPSPHAPLVTPEGALCEGRPGDPRGERDPACAPTATHEPVAISYHLAACTPGVRGPIAVRLGEQHLLTLYPGEAKTVRLPRGEVALTLDEGGREDRRELMLEGHGPLVVELGCDPRSFSGGLEALVLEGPRQGQTCETPIAVRAGGLDLTIDRDEVRTLFVPRGHHVLRVAGRERALEVGAGGARLAVCDE